MVRLAFAGAALLLVLLLISSYGSSEALVGDVPNYYPAPIGASVGNNGAKLEAASAAPPPPLAEGDTYRPPILDMKYLGGPVLWKPIRLYFVWYGTWTEAQKNLMRTVSNSLTPKKRIRQYPNLSNLWSVVTKYYQQLPGEGRKYTTNHVSTAGEVNDNFSFGHNISTQPDNVRRIITSHFGKGLPIDLEQGVYFLFTSADVAFSDQKPLSFCGYHYQECVDPTQDATFCGMDLNQLIFSFVPIQDGEFQNCNLFPSDGSELRGLPPNHLVSPNGAMDSTITVYLHELLELAVNPFFSKSPAWRYNRSDIQTETSDLCTGNFVAGDWFYCGYPIIYPDFNGTDDGRCYSLVDHHSALTEPKSQTTFNLYGIDGSKFLAQQFWSLPNKGCVLQPEASCPKSTIVLRNREGSIQRGLFFNGVGLQHYSPGQTCSWKIDVRGAKRLNLSFDKVALGYDDLDFVTVAHGNFLKKVTGFGNNIKVIAIGNEATIRFVTFGGRGPNPSSAGFIMRYEAVF